MTSPNEEKKATANAVISAGLAASLQPRAPDSIRIALSTKQNFALAAEEIFVHALNRTVWTYRDNYVELEMMMRTIRNVAMESVATEAGLAAISNLVFGEAAVREFLFTLQVQFFSQFAEFHTNWTELLDYIAVALTNTPIGVIDDPTLNLVPEDIRTRTFDVKRMSKLLQANTWLTMFIFVALWGRIHTYDELRANRRAAAGIPAA